MKSVRPWTCIAFVVGMLWQSASAQTRPPEELSSTATCGRCRITFDTVAQISVPSDSLSLWLDSKILRLPSGQYLSIRLVETPSPALHDQKGNFIRLLSRQGTGPGEVSSLDESFVALGAGDSVWVGDARKWHLFSPQLRYVRTENRHAAVGAIATPSGGLVMASMLSTPDRAGWPLHIVNSSGDIEKSFGIESPVLDPKALAAAGDYPGSYLFRHLVRQDDDTFWSYRASRFLLEQYDFRGRLLRNVVHLMDGWYGDAAEVPIGQVAPRGPGLSGVVRASQPGMVWLVYGVKNRTWHPPTAEEFKRGNPYEGMRDIVVEAVDLRSLRVLTTARLPNATFIRIREADNAIGILTAVDDVFYTVHVVQLHLNR
jgi:hypothetical protein